MENNEGKKGCCEGKENCEHGMSCGHGMGNCCHNWKRCHIMRKVIMIIILVVVFYLGAQWGEMRNERRYSPGFRAEKSMWGYDKRDYAIPTGATGSVTVEVAKPATPAQ